MNTAIIRAENVSKRFRMGERGPTYGTLGDALSGLKKLTRRRSPDAAEWMWALKDVNFAIEPGEAVAIVGRNGAGKSTLLKILSRITPPTEGRIALYGRVASLLEVGTGFHGELTGRENIFLNGAVLGMKRQEILSKFDEIVEFSEVAKFLDTPVKRYSSGMTMKLAFAVAAHLEPEILVVDEVLAVGDQAFQRKCLGKMRDVAGQGRTVLFVSHQMQAVSTLTTRAILMQGGQVAMDGPTSDVVAEYLRSGQAEGLIWEGEASATDPRITRVELHCSEPGGIARNGAALEFTIEVNTPRPLRDASMSVQACNDYEQAVMWAVHADSEGPWAREAGTYRLHCVVPHLRLYRGYYNLRLDLGASGKHVHHLEGLCPFQVVMWGQDHSYNWPARAAAYTEDSAWQVEHLDAANSPHAPSLKREPVTL